uniref:Uncharacterized protein n=1 Tax=Amphimedon queenslandica TaxID=400682 RepID=A0A1X7UC48_AMPQE
MSNTAYHLYRYLVATIRANTITLETKRAKLQAAQTHAETNHHQPSRFEVSSGPTVPTPALIQFMCDGSTLSGVAMAIENPAYKISLHKNKCFSGKYMAEPIK